MSTESQTIANRLNAQKSTGPRTPEGKAKVAQNAVTHGLTAKQPVLDSENHEEYVIFRDDFFRNYAPVGILEESLTHRAADTFWRLQRAQDYETAVLNTLIESAQIESRKSSIENDNNLLGQILLDDFRQHHCLEKIQKYEMALERSFYRTIKELRQLQSRRLSVAEASRFGSFPENSKNDKNKANSKPPIPTFDPMKLMENCKSNPMDLNFLTKITIKNDHDRQLARKTG